MKKTLKEKFDVIDIIFSNYGLFLTELEFKTPTMKQFAVKTLKDNSIEFEKLSEKVNDLIQDKAIGEIDHQEFASYTDRMEFLSNEFEKKAEILCNLEQDCIRIEILMKDEKVIFKFKEDEYMEPLIDYLKNNLGQKLLSN